MKEYIGDVAAKEGWRDATTVTVLASVLQALVDMGAADPEDLKAMIDTHGNVTSDLDGFDDLDELEDEDA